MIPGEIAGIRIPDSAIARQATELAREASPAFLFHHVLRTYLFGSLLAEQRGLALDEELFFLGAVLHDLGVTERGHGPQRFEVEGADWAHRFLLEQRYPNERADAVWDAIALHTSVGIADRKRPEIALVHQGASADVIGLRLDELPMDRVEQVLAALPRLDFKRAIVDAFVDTVQANPGSAVHTFTMDLARACVPDFACPTFPELIAAAPFGE